MLLLAHISRPWLLLGPHLSVTNLTWARSLSWPHTYTHTHAHAQCQAWDHSDIPNIPWCSSSPQLFWPVFVQLSVRTLLKQALHSLLPCRIAGQIIYGSLMAHYLAVCKSTFKSGKHGMTGYICSAENGFCSVWLFATDNGRQSKKNNLFITVACQIKAKGLTALTLRWLHSNGRVPYVYVQ